MPSTVRHANEARARLCLLTQKTLSRADLARELGLTRATASSIVANLIDAGQVIEIINDTAEREARTGRPSIQLSLNPDHAFYLGAYIGADHASLCAVDFVGAPRHFAECHLGHDNRTPEAVAQQLAGLVDEFIATVPDPGIITGLNVAVPGIVDLEGTILRAPPLGWSDIALKQILTQTIRSVPVGELLNDANAFAYAAQKDIGDLNLSDALFVLLEDGIGGCILSGGRILQGRDGLAGELGHILVGEKGFINLTGIEGALENFFARRAVLARFQGRGGRAASLRDFLTQLDQGNPLAREVLSECIGYFARGLAIATAMLNPQAVVVGGRASSLLPFAEKELQDRLASHLVASTSAPDIILSAVGREGPAVGAALKLHDLAYSLPEEARPGN